MYTIYVRNFDEWRQQARYCLMANIHPSLLQWLENNPQANFFADNIFNAKSINITETTKITVPKAFLKLAEKVACHRNLQRWALLYSLLWRLTHGEKYLLTMRSDPIMHEIYLMQKAVGRDMHKMKAFVRFQCYIQDNIEYYIAWHEPDHNIIKAMAPFFRDRFRIMNWIILTPDGVAQWNGNALNIIETAITSFDSHFTDEATQLWQTYYRAIFNPARIKLNAMRKEMPVRYWKNLPETQLISQMLQEAPQRVMEMIKHSQSLFADNQQSAQDSE